MSLEDNCGKFGRTKMIFFRDAAWWSRNVCARSISGIDDEEWRCHLDSGSCPRNNAWQMALWCFAKCPYRAHR